MGRGLKTGRVQIDEYNQADRAGSPIASVWHEIKELASAFLGFRVSVIGREGNGAAHACAKIASLSSPTPSWLGYTPLWLQEAVLRDCNDLINE
jgi:hypothetical protein